MPDDEGRRNLAVSLARYEKVHAPSCFKVCINFRARLAQQKANKGDEANWPLMTNFRLSFLGYLKLALLPQQEGSAGSQLAPGLALKGCWLKADPTCFSEN